MPRALFEKTGNAVWMSHLDLMRVFQRAFKRAGLPLTHTQGFNPRPSVSIALPLSVGVESVCELLDFDLEEAVCPCHEITQRLNEALVPGVRVLETYEDGRKIRDLALLRCRVVMEYDAGVPEGAIEAIGALYRQDALLVEKRSKNGVVQQDMIPMIRSFGITQPDDHCLLLDAVICCQNPTLNPAQLTAAVERYLPQYRPDFAKCSRVEIYDTNGNLFR